MRRNNFYVSWTRPRIDAEGPDHPARHESVHKHHAVWKKTGPVGIEKFGHCRIRRDTYIRSASLYVGAKGGYFLHSPYPLRLTPYGLYPSRFPPYIDPPRLKGYNPAISFLRRGPTSASLVEPFLPSSTYTRPIRRREKRGPMLNPES